MYKGLYKLLTRINYFHPYFLSTGNNDFQCISGKSRPFLTHATDCPGTEASFSMPCVDKDGRSFRNCLSFSDFCSFVI